MFGQARGDQEFHLTDGAGEVCALRVGSGVQARAVPVRQQGPAEAAGVLREPVTPVVGAVSMQRVAAGFGFTTVSLYRSVPGKTELVNPMIEMSVGDPPDLASIPGG